MDSHQQPKINQISEIEVDSHPVPASGANLREDAKVQPTLPKPIIRPWEVVNNKNKTGLGYDKDVSFHIPDYSKPIQLQSAGFL